MRRRTAATAGLLVVLLATVIGAASAGADDQRYRDHVFAQAEIEVSEDITFAPADPDAGLPSSLELDLYRPAGDTATDRPVVIWVHGGGFTAGNKGSMDDWAYDSARRGYVSASIEYRTLGEGLEGINAAVEDLRRAVRWFRSNAAALGIDPDRISAGGYSAGAVASLHAAYAGPIGADWNATVPWHIEAAVSFAGGTFATVGANQPPALFFHGDQDPRVDYDDSGGSQPPGFSAVSLCGRIRAAGVDCIFHTHAGATHNLTPFRTADLEVTAHFLSCRVGAPSPFSDTGGRWYEDASSWAAREELVTGFVDGTFRGKEGLTRGQYVNMLWNLLGRPAATAPHGFADVPPGAAYHDALDWAKEAGVIDGFPDGTFRGHETVPRGQAVALLWKATGSVSPSQPEAFPDVRANAWYADAVAWAVEHGVASGFPSGLFHPKDDVLRGQIVSMLHGTALDGSAWTPALQADPPPAACHRVDDPEALAP